MFGMCIEEDPDTPTGGPADRDDDAGHSAQESGSSDAEDFKDNECPACEQAFGSQDKDRLWVTMFLHFSLCPLFLHFVGSHFAHSDSHFFLVLAWSHSFFYEMTSGSWHSYMSGHTDSTLNCSPNAFSSCAFCFLLLI